MKLLTIKQKIQKRDKITLIIMTPSTILLIAMSLFSGFGALRALHCAIPSIAAIAIMIIYSKNVVSRTYLTKTIILAMILLPYYSTTAWSDWNFTYCDVKPKDANIKISQGFCKGIHTNKVYKQLYDWIKINTNKYSSDNDFIISYILTPMVHMIAKRRPSLDDSFLSPPTDCNQKYYRQWIFKMIEKNRQPAIIFVFENSPALNIGRKGPFNTFKHDLKGESYSFFGPWYDIKNSHEPLANYIREHMKLVQIFTYSKNIVRCFVDKSKL